MIVHTLEAAHRRWLDPDADLYGTAARMRSACLCRSCGEVFPLSESVKLNGSFRCLDCVDASTYPYDVYPEEEERHPVCFSCGDECLGSVIRFGEETYCTECAEYGRGEEDFA